jgi:hypothetical protein
MISNYYEAQVGLVNFQGFGFGYPSEGNTTLMRALVEGKTQLAGPSVLYTSERVNNLPNFSFPINMESLCAVRVCDIIIYVACHGCVYVTVEFSL